MGTEGEGRGRGGGGNRVMLLSATSAARAAAAAATAGTAGAGAAAAAECVLPACGNGREWHHAPVVAVNSSLPSRDAPHAQGITAVGGTFPSRFGSGKVVPYPGGVRVRYESAWDAAQQRFKFRTPNARGQFNPTNGCGARARRRSCAQAPRCHEWVRARIDRKQRACAATRRAAPSRAVEEEQVGGTAGLAPITADLQQSGHLSHRLLEESGSGSRPMTLSLSKHRRRDHAHESSKTHTASLWRLSPHRAPPPSGALPREPVGVRVITLQLRQVDSPCCRDLRGPRSRDHSHPARAPRGRAVLGGHRSGRRIRAQRSTSTKLSKALTLLTDSVFPLRSTCATLNPNS